MKRAVLVLSAVWLFALFTGSLAAESLKVLTYNVGLLRPFGSDMVPMVQVRARAAPAVIARFASDNAPDVILLEELWLDAYADAIASELATLGYTAVKPNAHSIIGLNTGLLLLVKSPLKVVDWTFAPFSRTTFIDSFARKGVLQATIQDTETGAVFALVGTHTVAVDTTGGVPKDAAQVRAVTSQVDQILAALKSRSSNGTIPTLLVGDFNVGPGYVDAVYQRIAQYPGLRETGAELVPGAPIVTWDPGNPLVKYGGYPEEPAAKIDHIFLLGGGTARWTPVSAKVVFTDPVAGLSLTPKGSATPVAVPLSDHYGFLVEIELAPGS
jgi:endonuclease/exonuclease/phosphatase family metal-dependent hydrolase